MNVTLSKTVGDAELTVGDRVILHRAPTSCHFTATGAPMTSEIFGCRIEDWPQLRDTIDRLMALREETMRDNKL